MFLRNLFRKPKLTDKPNFQENMIAYFKTGTKNVDFSEKLYNKLSRTEQADSTAMIGMLRLLDLCETEEERVQMLIWIVQEVVLRSIVTPDEETIDE